MDRQRYGRRGRRERRGQAQGKRDGGREGITFGQKRCRRTEVGASRSLQHKAGGQPSGHTCPKSRLSMVRRVLCQGDVTTSHQGLPNSFGYPLLPVQQAFEGNTGEPGTQQPVSESRGGAGSGLRNHKDEQEAGMERQCQGLATSDLLAI